jgi:transposase
LRERVLANLEGESMRKTAKRFRMSLSSVYRRKRQYQETGKRQAKRLGGAAVDGEGLE